ncbi:MAG: nicotinate-nucleotide adenylyltransferase [Faecalimonas sp.]|nr:nicotinate-nucleotide adenylyltransferase [Faecalimonas sp.]
MKIGIVGGTFDPIHNGHLMLGEYAKRQYALDEIWYMPNGNPPHKENASIVSSVQDRVEMVSLAIAGISDFKLQLFEVEHEEVHYSYQTMAHFRKAYPEHQFFFVLGADSLFQLEKWVHPELLLKECTILAAFRDEVSEDKMQAQIAYLNQKYGGDIRLLNTPNIDVSSSEIRKKFECSVSIKNEVPLPVYAYLHLKQLLPKKRFIHTMGVVHTARDLAIRYGQDIAKAMLAALLHDCAKGIPAEKRIALCKDYELEVSASEQMNAELLHAKLGAQLAKSHYGVSDAEILDAIRYHTTGRPKMTFLDKIIYIADYIEPNRKDAPNLKRMRELAFVDIEQCLYCILEQSLAYLKTKNEVIDPMTEQTYFYYKSLLKE